jgi:hypothetical protein
MEYVCFDKGICFCLSQKGRERDTQRARENKCVVVAAVGRDWLTEIIGGED